MNHNQDHIFNISKNKGEYNETFCMDELMDELYIYVKQALQTGGKPHIGVEPCKMPRFEKCMVNANRKHLRYIFIILLDNAVRYTDMGCIIYGYYTSMSNHLHFFVDDTGLGIYNENDLDLTIAHGLIKQMGGDMEVLPSKIAGTSVNFTIEDTPFEGFEN